MYYTCKSCGRKAFRGVLPGVTCGMLFLLYFAVSLMASALLVNRIPVSSVVLKILIAVAIAIPGMVAIHTAIAVLEWLCVSLVPCKRCGSHRFTLGRYEGFGL